MTLFKVSPYLLRGPRPDDMIELKRLGVKSIVNLEAGWFEFFHREPVHEDILAREAGITFLHRPMDDVLATSPAILRETVKEIRELERKGLVYIHCLHGVDRTGIVCALYRVKIQGWTVDDAIREMYTMGFHKFPYEWLGWVRDLREAAK